MDRKKSSLETKLHAALASRDQRWIRRRLPDPNASSSTSLLIDFNSNDYLSLSNSSALRSHYLKKLSEAPDVLGSGGSRLLVNGKAHVALEARLADFFRGDAALLFNSGFDANVGFFSCVPQPGDVIVYDEYIHASVHDGIRSSRAKDAQFSFSHNSMPELRRLLFRLRGERVGLRTGENSLFLSVESLYSMDGTFAPLKEIADLLDEVFPLKNGYLVVDEAHATGIYGPQGRGCVALLGLEDRVLARLHTFGKALAATGGASLHRAFSIFSHWPFSGDHNHHTHSGLSFKLCPVAYLYHLAKLRKHYCRRLLVRHADRRYRPTCKFSPRPCKHKVTLLV